ncbi:uncharacterized protein [Ambystoma mexicanum]|uniref:uncharacterized protein isoform X2 n=1 Tax=Ambystoma mexicanum TaxID=8296 RepID=UPI0037E81F51
MPPLLALLALLLSGPSWVPVGVGTSTSLQCHYSTEDYRLVPRAWCRLQPRMGCQPLRGVQALAVPGVARRYRIVEDHVKGVTTLSVEGLQPEDNGVYECRIQLPGAPVVMKRFLLQVRIRDEDERLLLAPSLRTMDANLATAGSPSEKRYHGIRRQMALALGCSLAAAFLLGAIVFGALMLIRSRKKTGDLKPPSGSFRDATGPPFGVPGESAKIVACDLKDEDDADLIKYTTLRLSSKPGTPEATYANVRYQSSKQEAPESPSILAISGTVEYATVFFRPSGALIPRARQQQKELAMHTVELPGSSTNALH